MFTFLSRRRSQISFLLLFTFIHLLFGCNYYRTKSYDEFEEMVEQINETLEESRYVLFVQGDVMWASKNIDFDQNSISAELEPLPEKWEELHQSVDSLKRKRITIKKHRPITTEVRIHLKGDATIIKGDATISAGQQQIDMESIDQVEVYDRDLGRTVANYAGVTIGLFAILIIIILLTKSSCPYIYAHDGNGFVFEGESYGGAIFKPLERVDYIPLEGIKAVDGISSVRIANELLEKQFVNQVRLIEIETAPDDRALIDRHGKVHIISDPVDPIKATSEGLNYTQELQANNSLGFYFDGPSNTSSITLEFPNSLNEGKLVVNAKGSLWLDYVFGEFTKLIGNEYPEFIEKQNKRAPEELHQWIEDQNLQLKVYEQVGSEWVFIDYFDTVGPLGEGRDLVMSIPSNGMSDGTRKLKLETGFMFWELFHASMDYSKNGTITSRELSPISAINQQGNNVLPRLLKTDDAYLIQPQIDDYATIDFPSTTADNELKIHRILEISGYYEHVRSYENQPDMLSLLPFRKAGYFSDFSRERYDALNLQSLLVAND